VTLPKHSTRHATCVAQSTHAVLIEGPPGSGKSSLALRLIDAGFTLVADDRVHLHGHLASPPPALAGLLEIRGLGIVRMPYQPSATLTLVITLGTPRRLPDHTPDATLNLPRLTLNGADPAATATIKAALACLDGRYELLAGFTGGTHFCSPPT